MRVSGWAIAVVLAVFLGAAMALLPAPATTRAWSTGAYSASDEDLMVSLVNQARASAGLPALRANSAIRDTARFHSSDMVVHSYFGHLIPPDCTTIFRYLTVSYKSAAENIGWNGYPDDQATTWQFNYFMGSSTHRANILNADFTDVGVGAYKADWVYGSACGQTGDGKSHPGTHMYTLIFTQSAGSSATPTPTAKPTSAPTAKPTAAPTAAPTAKATAAPTAKATAAPTASPTATAAAQPAVTPGPVQSAPATPQPTPSPTFGTASTEATTPAPGSEAGAATSSQPTATILGSAAPPAATSSPGAPLSLADGPLYLGLLGGLIVGIAVPGGWLWYRRRQRDETKDPPI